MVRLPVNILLVCTSTAAVEADISYPDHEKDQMAALDTLAAHYVQLARREKSKDLKKEYFAQVL